MNSRNFRPVDIATLIYISIEILLILLFKIGEAGWLLYLLFYLAAAGIVMIFVIFPVAGSGSLWRALRIIYPLFLFTFLYEALKDQVFMVIGQPLDNQIVGLERIIFGHDPSFLLQQHMQVWLNELMNFGYISYYFMLPVALGLLLVKRRWRSVEILITSSAVTFYVSYLIFIFYPVTGPRFYLADHYYLPLIGPFFTKLAGYIIERGGLYGGAMPSSHCAVGFLAMTAIAGNFRRLGIPAIAMLVLLCISTVYGRYHYLSDVCVGLLIGWLALRISKLWVDRYLERIDNDKNSRDGYERNRAGV